MRVADLDILMVPGYTNSGPDHWQTRWETKLKTARRVEQADWNRPDRDLWSGRVVDEVNRSRRPVVIIAHSCGVPTVVHAASRLSPGRGPGLVMGAFLVATPSEAKCAEIVGIDPAFAVFPRDPLPFPSLLVASSTDEYCTMEEAGDLALAWGSMLVEAGDAGHLNTASGHGPWADGAMRLGLFLKQLASASQ
ncbi:MAG: hypothetical protein RL291_909 [Pseudomonadota bacterium]|jgi:predicted alpha/beta hydrolase family esterase